MAMRIPEAVRECSNISDEPKILNHTSTSHYAIGGLGHPTTSGGGEGGGRDGGGEGGGGEGSGGEGRGYVFSRCDGPGAVD